LLRFPYQKVRQGLVVERSFLLFGNRQVHQDPENSGRHAFQWFLADTIPKLLPTRVIAIKNAQKSIEDGTMGSPYLSSNESIILSTNNVIVNTVPAEAILTNERLMLIDARHVELRPQDIPFPAIETVTIGENSDQDPMLSLSLVTGPGVTQALGIVFPQPPRMRRVAERDEWAARLKELSIVSTRKSGTTMMEILPPWVPGPLPDEARGEAVPVPESETDSKFRNPPLVPRKPREPAGSKNRTAIIGVVVAVALIALAAGAYLLAPSLFGQGGSPLPPKTASPTQTLTTAPTPELTTVATMAITTAATTLVTAPPPAAAEVIIPQTGVWIRVKYEGSFSGSAGAPGRFTPITGTGDTVRQLSVKNEIVSAIIQKEDNTGRKLTVEIYDGGKLIKSGSVTAPKGTVNINADLRTA
jgi:hypothetical protein